MTKKYIGKVVDNADPLYMNRVRVRISKLHDGVEDGDLPWAIPETGSSENGSSNVPTVGKEIYLAYQVGDSHELTYTGLATRSEQMPDALKTNYPSRKGYVDEAGNTSYRDVSDGSVHFSSPSGTSVDIASDGSITINNPTSLTVTSGGCTMVLDGSGINLTGGDIIADGISLKNHLHDGVTPGAGDTGKPK